MTMPRKISYASPLQFIPPFEKGGLGGILKCRIRKSPSIPLFKGGHRFRSYSQPQIHHSGESRNPGFLPANQNNKMDTGLRRYDETGQAEGK
jgi:hypothetical protein